MIKLENWTHLWISTITNIIRHTPNTQNQKNNKKALTQNHLDCNNNQQSINGIYGYLIGSWIIPLPASLVSQLPFGTINLKKKKQHTINYKILPPKVKKYATKIILQWQKRNTKIYWKESIQLNVRF